jgi:hypothetical protein
VHYNGAKAHCIIHKFCTTGGQSLLFMLGTSKKNFSFYFKCYNLTICEVNFFETFCTCSPSSLGQDPSVKIPNSIFFFVFASWARNGRFEHFYEKNDLHPLGVKSNHCTFYVQSLLVSSPYKFSILKMRTLLFTQMCRKQFQVRDGGLRFQRHSNLGLLYTTVEKATGQEF